MAEFKHRKADIRECGEHHLLMHIPFGRGEPFKYEVLAQALEEKGYFPSQWDLVPGPVGELGWLIQGPELVCVFHEVPKLKHRTIVPKSAKKAKKRGR